MNEALQLLGMERRQHHGRLMGDLKGASQNFAAAQRFAAEGEEAAAARAIRMTIALLSEALIEAAAGAAIVDASKIVAESSAADGKVG